MYHAAGFVEVEPFNDEVHAHHWFAKPLTSTRDAPSPRSKG